MKKSFMVLLFLAMQITLVAQECFLEGTKWTEIRLDTLKYDSWYSQVDDEWVPNFETIEYYVKGEYTDNNGDKYRCVYTNGPEWTDSLTLLLLEADNNISTSVLVHDYDGNTRRLSPGVTYQFDWSVGKGLYYEDILMSNTTSIGRSRFYYGIINEIKERFFGGSQPLKYVDLDGKAPDNDSNSPIHNVDTRGGRIIQGIGITEWNDGECLFGPSNPYSALTQELNTRHYRSMLVHFERNGEILYDVWPVTQIGYFYYYNGNKIPLTLNENKVCVSIPKDCDKTCESIRTNVKVLTTIIDETFDIIVITRSDFEKLTTLDFWEEGAKSVILTSCYFTENNEEICTTPYIDVRLKKEEDFDLLTTYAEKYGLRIVKQDSLMPLWYILAITQNSEKSPLEYANELFESGDFAASVPDWGELGDPFNTVRSITTTKTNSSYGIYNLQGRRLKSVPIKGIYIQNGRKRISH